MTGILKICATKKAWTLAISNLPPYLNPEIAALNRVLRRILPVPNPALTLFSTIQEMTISIQLRYLTKQQNPTIGYQLPMPLQYIQIFAKIPITVARQLNP